MKKIIKISVLALLATLASCTKVTTVTMEDSVDARVSAAMFGYQKTLCTASNGWILEVETSEGFYNFYMEFSDNNMVTMYTDNLNYYSEFYDVPKTSTYNFRALERPVLSFDTYSYLAIINDPDNSVSGSSDSMGLGTDFEFEVVEATENEFTLRGRVNRIDARLYRATADESEYAKKGGLMDILEDAMYYNDGAYSYFMNGNTKVSLTMSGRAVSTSYVDEDNNVIIGNSFVKVALDHSMTLITPIVLEGEKALSEIKFDKESGEYAVVCGTETKAVEAQGTPIIPLHLMLGVGKPYTNMQTIVSMYPSIDPSENALGYYYYMSYYYLNRNGYPMQYSMLTFEKTESGEDRLAFEGQFGRYMGWCMFYIEFNEEGDEFTITERTFENDSYGNLEGAFMPRGAKYLLDYMVGKTFKIEWSSVKFAPYEMGQLTEVGASGPSFYVGALFGDE